MKKNSNYKLLTSGLALFALLQACGGGGDSGNQSSSSSSPAASNTKTAQIALASTPSSTSNFAYAVNLVKQIASAPANTISCEAGASLPSYSATTDSITLDGQQFTAASLDDNFLTLNSQNRGAGTIYTQYYKKSGGSLIISDVDASAPGKPRCKIAPQSQTLDLKPHVATIFGARVTTISCPAISVTIRADGAVTFSGQNSSLDSVQIAVRRIAAQWLGESFNSKSYIRLSSSSSTVPSIVFAISESGEALGAFENTDGLGTSGKLGASCAVSQN